MMEKRRVIGTSGVLAGILAGVFMAGGAAAQTASYEGKTLRMIITSGAGGGYDTYARVLSAHLARHLPGNPTIVNQNMPGASGMVGTNWAASDAAPKDGSVIISTYNALLLEPLFGNDKAKYDPRKFEWIGSIGKQQQICVTWHTSPIKTIEQAKEREVVVSATGATGNAATMPRMLNTMLGTKFKVVSGYPGANNVRLAMEKGEVDGLCAQYDGWKSTRPEWVAQKKITTIIQFASKRTADLPDAPTLSEFAKTDEERQIMKFIDWGVEDRAIVMAPGVPADRVAAMEKAYMDTLADPAFLKDAEGLQFDIQPIAGKTIREFVDDIMALKPETVEKIKKAMGID